jgi:hypothetical protein
VGNDLVHAPRLFYFVGTSTGTVDLTVTGVDDVRDVLALEFIANVCADAVGQSIVEDCGIKGLLLESLQRALQSIQADRVCSGILERPTDVQSDQWFIFDNKDASSTQALWHVTPLRLSRYEQLGLLFNGRLLVGLLRCDAENEGIIFWTV